MLKICFFIISIAVDKPLDMDDFSTNFNEMANVRPEKNTLHLFASHHFTWEVFY